MSNLWYTTGVNTDCLFQALCRLYRDGTSLVAALRTEGVPESSYYAWRKDNKPVDAEMKVRAQAHVAAEVDLERVRVSRMQEVRRQDIEEALLEGVAPVIKGLLEAAKTGTPHEQVAVLRELRQWLSDGVLNDVETSAAEQPRLPASSLPDFLSSNVKKIVAESPGGDKITLERGQVIEGTAGTPAPPRPPGAPQ